MVLSLAPRAWCSFEDTGVGPRAAALGGAVASYDPTAAGMFYNPALLVGVQQGELFTSQENYFMGLSDGSKITRQVFAFARPLKRGRYGNLGLSMNTFGLGGLYNEKATMLSYGRKLGQRFAWGLSARQLAIAYGSDAASAKNAVAGAGASAMGIDLGMTYKTASNQWGLSILNANEPDLGVKFSNKVDRVVNIGLTLRRENFDWSHQLTRAGADIRYRSGIEHWRSKKRFALRGGLALGTRQFRDFSWGFAYRLSKAQFDYAMVLPLSGISGTLGHHRAALTFRWGRKTFEAEEEEEKQKELAAAAAAKIDLAGSTMAVRVQPVLVTEVDRRSADSYVSSALDEVDAGDYRGALENLRRANAGPVETPRNKELEGRVAAVAMLKSTVKPGSPQERLVRRGLSAFVLGDGNTAIESLLYATQKWPSDKSLKPILDLVTKEYPDVAARLKPIEGLSLVDQKLEECLSLIYDGQYTAAVAMTKEVLELEPDNVMALVRQGSAYWALGRKETARAVWERALQIDPGNIDIQFFLKQKGTSAPRIKPPEPVRKPASGKPGEVTPELQAQYDERVAYYERMKRMGVNKRMLEMILKQTLKKFEGSGIDTSYLEKEADKY